MNRRQSAGEAKDTDVSALAAGFITITPIQYDLTRYDLMDTLQKIVEAKQYIILATPNPLELSEGGTTNPAGTCLSMLAYLSLPNKNGTPYFVIIIFCNHWILYFVQFSHPFPERQCHRAGTIPGTALKYPQRFVPGRFLRVCKRDNGLSRKIVFRQKGFDRSGKRAPPNRVADENEII